MAQHYLALLLSSFLLSPSTSLAMEDLNEDSMEVVSAEGLGHLLTAQPSERSGVHAQGVQNRSHLTADQLGQIGLDNSINQSADDRERVDQHTRVRTNEVTPRKIADIDIRMDGENDRTTSSVDGNKLRFDLSTQVDSVSAMNVRHTPDDVNSRGSFYVDQIQVNSTVIINGQ